MRASKSVQEAHPALPLPPPECPFRSAPVAAAPPGHLGHRARMRRRLLAGGEAALLDHELIELVLFQALPRRDTKALAHAVCRRFGGFAAAIAAPAAELQEVEGLGEAGVAALKVIQVAAIRLARAEVARAPIRLEAYDALLRYLNAAVARERVEQFRVLYLDTRNRLLADDVLSRGTVDQATAYPREVVRRALELDATALILVHNHPSGDPTPSPADIALTTEVKAAAELFGVALHDHVVIGNGKHVSLRTAGLL